jgi:type II protein arginine methyltransferase
MSATHTVLSRYPQVIGNPRAMAILCQSLSGRGLVADAFAMGLAAEEAAPDDIEIRDLVRAGLSDDVPAWHVPMLHDGPRNRCYAKAIARAVQPGMRVLEIGTGAGLLSLLAARAGAEVTTCESNPIVLAAAREIAQRNGLADRIRFINKPSGQLELGTDLDAPADLLMSELFDDTLFGDSIVAHIADAHERLLVPGAIVLPPRAELRCALVEVAMPDSLQPLAMVEGFDLSAFNILSPPMPRQIRVFSNRARQRSHALSALPADFEGAVPFGETRGTIKLRSSGGRVNGIGQWMRIDFGNGVIYENDPFDGPWSHWGAPIHVLAAPRETQPGDMIEIEVSLVGRQLVMRPVDD